MRTMPNWLSTTDQNRYRTLSIPRIVMSMVLVLLAFVMMLPIISSGGPYRLQSFSLNNISWMLLGISVGGLALLRLTAGTFWDPRVFMFVSFVMFNAGQFIVHLIDPTQKLFFNRFADYRIVPAAYFIAVCLVMWLLGASLTSLWHKQQQQRIEDRKDRMLMFFGWLFMAIGALPMTMRLISAVQIVRGGGYAALYQGEVQVGLGNIQALLAAFFLPGLFYLLASGNLRKRPRQFLLLMAFLVVMVNFVLGHRSAAMLPLIALLFVYHYRIRQIPRIPVILSFVGIFAVLLPAIAVVRRAKGIDLSVNGMIDALQSTGNPALASMYEMGGSAMPVIYSIMFIPPSLPPIDLVYFKSLLLILPSFGGLNLSLSQGTYDQWLIQKVDPVIAAQGGALGFAAIAEMFVNFGWVGGPVAFLVASILVHLFLARFGNYRIAWHVAVTAVFLYVMLFWARSETLAMARTLMWFAIIPFLITNLLNQLWRRRIR